MSSSPRGDGKLTPSVTMLGFTTPTAEAAKLGVFDSEDLIELSGRNDYGPRSLAKMGDNSIIQRWISSGEESMIEMVDATFLIECSRVVSHELVRHRLCSFQQESQRFVKYDDVEFDYMFHIPDGLNEEQAYAVEELYRDTYETYQDLRTQGVSPQLARYVLPNGFSTRIVMKTNLRGWRHIIKLRIHSSAQPEMRSIMRQIYQDLKLTFPRVFADMDDIIDSGERFAR